MGLTKVLGDFPSLYEARSALPEVARDWDPCAAGMSRVHDDSWLIPASRTAPPTHTSRVEPCCYYKASSSRDRRLPHACRWMQQQDEDPAKFTSVLEQIKKLRGSKGERFHARVLDWCGNTGGNALIMAQKNPSLNITVLDLPTQCAQADAAFAVVRARISVLVSMGPTRRPHSHRARGPEPPSPYYPLEPPSRCCAHSIGSVQHKGRAHHQPARLHRRRRRG